MQNEFDIGSKEFWQHVARIRSLEEKIGVHVEDFRRRVYNNGLRGKIERSNSREMSGSISLENESDLIKVNTHTENCHTKFTFARGNAFLEIIGFENQDDPCFSVEDFNGSDKMIISLIENTIDGWKNNGWIERVGS